MQTVVNGTVPGIFTWNISIVLCMVRSLSVCVYWKSWCNLEDRGVCFESFRKFHLYLVVVNHYSSDERGLQKLQKRPTRCYRMLWLYVCMSRSLPKLFGKQTIASCLADSCIVAKDLLHADNLVGILLADLNGEVQKSNAPLLSNLDKRAARCAPYCRGLGLNMT